MKKFFFLKILLLFFLFKIPTISASTQTKIIANVGNQIVSSYELKNKVNTILFLSNQKINQININNVKNQALIALVNSKLEKIEIKNYILSNFSLPFFPKKSDILPFLINDKKNKFGKISFSLLNHIGDCMVDNLFSLDEL